MTDDERKAVEAELTRALRAAQQRAAEALADYDALEDAAAAVVRAAEDVPGADLSWRLLGAITELRDSGRDEWWQKTNTPRPPPSLALRVVLADVTAERDELRAKIADRGWSVSRDDLQHAIELARLAFQVEIPGDERHLVDVDSLTVDVAAPGCQDARRSRADTWRICLGEEGDGGLARTEGATLAEAVEAMRVLVEERAARVRSMLGGGA